MYGTDKQISEMLCIGRRTLWRWVQNGDFPQPKRLSPGTTRWLMSEVEAWIKAKGA